MIVIDAFRGYYHFLSNFYESPVEYQGIKYLNSEAAFQAMKCKNPKDRHIFESLNPSMAKQMGRRIDLRCDWEDVKEQIMYEIVKAKFAQNEILKKKLLATAPYRLEEGNTWGDRTWGTVKGKGKNLLGKILMRVRDELEVQ